MIKQISIYTENRKGALRTLVRTLADAGVALRAFVTNENGEFGTVRILTDNDSVASKTLSDAGYLTKLTSVLAVDRLPLRRLGSDDRPAHDRPPHRGSGSTGKHSAFQGIPVTGQIRETELKSHLTVMVLRYRTARLLFWSPNTMSCAPCPPSMP